ncbi:hypothetical protein L6452_30629 [Arctium lappa]|uniref:Uncharacterized protein n=1 Tax=Arctium lappa TaxID=4217 RepID=A0ACB8ZIH6_ARCLA|nr:hypothetical protein L6452_30629 [Arctium lappa]
MDRSNMARTPFESWLEFSYHPKFTLFAVVSVDASLPSTSATLIADCVVLSLSTTPWLSIGSSPFFSHINSSPPSLVHTTCADDVSMVVPTGAEAITLTARVRALELKCTLYLPSDKDSRPEDDSLRPNASVVAPSATIHADPGMVGNVKQILPTLGNLTDEVGILKSKEILFTLQQPQVHPPSFTDSDRENLVLAVEFAILQTQTIANIKDQLKSLSGRIPRVDDDKEGEKDITVGSKPTEIYKNPEATPCSFVKDTLIMPSSLVSDEDEEDDVLDDDSVVIKGRDDDDDDNDDDEDEFVVSKIQESGVEISSTLAIRQPFEGE